MKKVFVVISMLILFGCCMHGCGKKQEQEVINTEKNRVCYREEHISLNVRYELAVIKNDTIYGLCYKENVPVILCQNKQTAEIENEIFVDPSLEVVNIQADAHGEIYFTAKKDGVYRICTINDEKECIELTDWCFDEEGVPKGIYIGDQDDIYVWWEAMIPIEKLFPEDGRKDGYVVVDQIYALDNQFNVRYCRQIPQFQGTQLIDFYLAQEGEGLLLVNDENGIYTQQMTPEDNEEEKCYLDAFHYEEGQKLFSVSDKGMLYCCGGELYEYDVQTNMQTQLLNLSTYGLITEDLLYIAKKGDTIELIDTYEEWDRSEYTTLNPGESDRQVLTLGIMLQTSDIQRVVAAFNRYNKDYIVDIVEYYNEAYGYTEAADRMKLDVISGKAPDVMDMSGVDASVFSSKGALVDLYALMEQDEEFSKERLISSVRKAYETDGHLYCIAPAFHLVTAWGSNEVLQGKTGVSLQELKGILKEYGKDLNAVWGFSADEPVLTTLCTFGINEFIDWDSRDCDFTGTYFRDVLEFVKEYDNPYPESQSKGIREGNVVITTGMIDSVAAYQSAKQLYGEDVTFIGYPTNGGSGTAAAFRGAPLAINARKEHIEGAWEFVKYYITNGYSQGGFPVEVYQFEAALSLAKQPDVLVDVEGATFEVPKIVYSDADTKILIYEASEEDVEGVRKLVDSVSNKFEYDVPVMQIITEEAEAYLKGDKTQEEVAEIIQNRVKLYLSEN